MFQEKNKIAKNIYKLYLKKVKFYVLDHLNEV